METNSFNLTFQHSRPSSEYRTEADGYSQIVMGNLTEYGNEKTLKQLFCSAELTEGVHFQLIYLSIFNIFFSITAFWGNALILVALHKKSSLHPPMKLFLRCLAISDICTGVFSEPLIVMYWMSVVYERWDICPYALNLSVTATMILCAVSLLTMTAISVDRLLALLLGLRYRRVVTLKRTYFIVTVFWVGTIIWAATYFWNYHITLWYRYIGVVLCLLISTFSYGKIFLSLRQHQMQVQIPGQPSQAVPLNIARYRKALSTVLWLQLTLIVCYLPFGVTEALTTQKRLSSSFYVAREFVATLIFLNSTLNPILYIWRIREVRQAVKDTIRRFNCSLN